MTTTEVPVRVTPAPVGRYTLTLSSDREHREAAQRLRHTVFGAEPGFAAANGPGDREVDRFDDYCDHLLVRDELLDETVGCYRILPPDAARAAGGLYTATEFDIGALGPLLDDTVELGRACVRPGHRTGSVLGLMWAGMLNYLELSGHRWAVGCVSVPMRLPDGEAAGSNVRAVRDRLLADHATAPDRRVRPLHPVPGIDTVTSAAKPVLPPLLRGYLRLGARICGEPAHDPDFGVADFVALLGMHDVDPRYLRRLRSVPVAMR